MIISLVGYMGSGKSSVGKQLAIALDLPFLDLDEFIERKSNATISELISSIGEIRFRKLEKDALEEVFGLYKQMVLSLGGGTPVYYDNMNFINRHSASIYLRMTPVELTNRLVNEKLLRPLIARIPNDELPEFIAKHLFERSAYYNQSNVIIDVKTKLIDDLVEEIKSHLQNLPQ